MSDAARRFKDHMWQTHGIDRSAVIVTLGAGGKVQSFAVDPNVAHMRWVGSHGQQTPRSWGVTFDGYTVPEVNFDGVAGAVAGMTIR